MTETFKTIGGYENYEVSDFGNVRNKKTGRILKGGLDSKGYKRLNLWNSSGGKMFNIHKLVAAAFLENPDNKRCIDHIDNDRTNNNLSNLRYCTYSENGMNKSFQSNNTSGIRGVFFDKARNKWRAEIKINSKSMYIGRYDTIEEATTARRLKAKELFKEYMHRVEELVEEII